MSNIRKTPLGDFSDDNLIDLTKSCESIERQLWKAKKEIDNDLLLFKFPSNFRSEDRYGWNTHNSFDCNLGFLFSNKRRNKFLTNTNCFARLSDDSREAAIREATHLVFNTFSSMTYTNFNLNTSNLAAWWKILHFFLGDNFLVNKYWRTQLTVPAGLPIETFVYWGYMARSPAERPYEITTFCEQFKKMQHKPAPILQEHPDFLNNIEWLPTFVSCCVKAAQDLGDCHGHSAFPQALADRDNNFNLQYAYLGALAGFIGSPRTGRYDTLRSIENVRVPNEVYKANALNRYTKQKITLVTILRGEVKDAKAANLRRPKQGAQRQTIFGLSS